MQSSPGILFFKEIVQSFQGVFPVAGRGSCLLPEFKIVTEVGPVACSLKFGLWLKTFVMGGLCMESAVQADMKITVAFGTDRFPRKELIDLNFFFAMSADLHMLPPVVLKKSRLIIRIMHISHQ